MRKIARAKAQQMVRASSPTPSLQTVEQISEEERAEIVKYVETEETEVTSSNSFIEISFIVDRFL